MRVRADVVNAVAAGAGSGPWSGVARRLPCPGLAVTKPVDVPAPGPVLLFVWWTRHLAT